MENQEEKLTIYPLTNRPHTFFLSYKFNMSSESYSEAHITYGKLAQEFVDEVNETGLKANLKTRYKWYSNYYITFRSKYDVVAFKLRWL